MPSNVKYDIDLFLSQTKEMLQKLDLLPQHIIDSEGGIPSTIKVDLEEDVCSASPQLNRVIDELDEERSPPPELRKESGKVLSHDLFVIGHSMGGLIANEFAALHQNEVKKVVLFNCAGLPVDIRPSK